MSRIYASSHQIQKLIKHGLASSRVACSLLGNSLLGCLWLGGRCALQLLGACSFLGWFAFDLANHFLGCAFDLGLDRGFLRGRLLGRGLLDAGTGLCTWLGCVGFRFGGLLGRHLAGRLGRNGLEDAGLGVAGCAAGSGHCDGNALGEGFYLKSVI